MIKIIENKLHPANKLFDHISDNEPFYGIIKMPVIYGVGPTIQTLYEGVFVKTKGGLMYFPSWQPDNANINVLKLDVTNLIEVENYSPVDLTITYTKTR